MKFDGKVNIHVSSYLIRNIWEVSEGVRITCSKFVIITKLPAISRTECVA